MSKGPVGKTGHRRLCLRKETTIIEPGILLERKQAEEQTRRAKRFAGDRGQEGNHPRKAAIDNKEEDLT